MKKITSFIVVCWLGLTTTYACSCATLSFDKATEWADEIFYGRLIQVREVENYILESGEVHTRIWGALFEVEKKWKGSNSRLVEVFQPNTSCDFYFEFPNQPYIVYAKRGELIPWDSTRSFVGLGTWLCARNANAYTYYLGHEFAFDDRGRLDKKYEKLVELSNFKFPWKGLLIGVTLLTGFILGRMTKKSRNNFATKV